MNESQGSSLAAQRRPAAHAVLGALSITLALAAALAGCGQKGPLFLPAQAGTAAKPAKPANRLPSAPEDGRGAATVPPADSASAPGLPPVAR